MEFLNLHKTLFESKIGNVPCFPITKNDGDFNGYFEQVLMYYSENMWNCPLLLRFLDNNHSFSYIQQMQLSRMTSTVSVLNFQMLFTTNFISLLDRSHHYRRPTASTRPPFWSWAPNTARWLSLSSHSPPPPPLLPIPAVKWSEWDAPAQTACRQTRITS